MGGHSLSTNLRPHHPLSLLSASRLSRPPPGPSSRADRADQHPHRIPLTASPTLAATAASYPGFTQATTMASFPPAAHDVFHLDDLLTPDERAIRSKVRAYMEAEVAPIVADFWERAEFPHALVPGIAGLGLGGATITGYGCPGQSVVGAAMAVIEMARVDASMSTFLMVHNSLAMLTIGEWPTCVCEKGREGQKEEHPPTPDTKKLTFSPSSLLSLPPFSF